jgi:hypothetical protein
MRLKQKNVEFDQPLEPVRDVNNWTETAGEFLTNVF